MKQQPFSHRVKAEAAESITGRKKCDICLLGMLLFSNSFKENELLFQTESETCRDLYVRLITHAAEDKEAAQVFVYRHRGRKPLHCIRIENADSISKISNRLGFEIFEYNRTLEGLELTEKTVGTFLAGVFFACGSVADPEKEYHLEFVVPTQALAEQLLELLQLALGINAKCVQRGASSVVYIKGSESIEDILTAIGATNHSLEIMNVKVYKDIRNLANRRTNCDTANSDRQNRSAERQIAAIEAIKASKGGLSQLPDELLQVAQMRLNYPLHSLDELAKEFLPPLSKSGLNHRFARLEAIAKDLK